MIDFEETVAASEFAMRPLSLEEGFAPTFPDDKAVLNQVEHILRSEELRGCEVLRRLLRFLAAKSISGEADELKEYIVAIDGLGKPSSYDPRHNSAVRIQVGRLRRKLADYYLSEGKEDQLVLEVPKGRFKLKCHGRVSAPLGKSEQYPALRSALNEHEQRRGPAETLTLMRIGGLIFAVAIISIAVSAYYHLLKPVKAKTNGPANVLSWTPEMEDLWRPFIETDRPLIVAIEDPLFAELDGKKGIYYRNKTLNRWKDIVAAPEVKTLRAVLKSPSIEPSRYYTAFGEVDASFLIARLMGSRVQNLSVVKTSNLSLRELEGNNVLFVGIENLFFSDPIQATPVQASLQPVHEGIRDINPGANQPTLYVDEYSTAPAEQGVAYALVTHLPGPMGRNDVESFTSSRAAGYVAAVRAFTDPAFVKTVVDKLKQSTGGHMPRYYQVLLKVKFNDEVPTETTCMLARELR